MCRWAQKNSDRGGVSMAGHGLEVKSEACTTGHEQELRRGVCMVGHVLTK